MSNFWNKYYHTLYKKNCISFINFIFNKKLFFNCSTKISFVTIISEFKYSIINCKSPLKFFNILFIFSKNFIIRNIKIQNTNVIDSNLTVTINETIPNNTFKRTPLTIQDITKLNTININCDINPYSQNKIENVQSIKLVTIDKLEMKKEKF